MNLFKMWEEHYVKNALPPEWPIWEDFRTWAINNRYKAEYGYKGEFSPQGCMKAMPDYKEGPTDAIVAVDHAYGSDKTVIQSNNQQQKGGTKNASKKTNARSGKRAREREVKTNG